MGDIRRFDLFANLISKHIPKSCNIADISGGKGYLQLALKEHGYKNITSFDKRYNRIKNSNYKYGYFDYSKYHEFSGIVAMHPDEGTDHAVMYCIKNKCVGLICPCCVKPHATHLLLHHNFNNWKKHLTQLVEKAGMEAIWTKLKMTGKNEVLIIKP